MKLNQEKFGPEEHGAIDKYFELVASCSKSSELHGGNLLGFLIMNYETYLTISLNYTYNEVTGYISVCLSVCT